MEFENILYTPLDTGSIPNFDINSMYEWLSTSHIAQEKWRRRIGRLTSESAGIKVVYPWNISLAYFNMTGKGPGWLSDFDVKFPNLADFFTKCFGFNFEDIGSIIMLPMKEDVLGPGFYHQDHDWYGLRLYLEFEDIDNNLLLIKRTKEPYDKQSMIQTPVDENLLQQDEIPAKILNNRCCWYINNVRACHNIYVKNPGKRRLAVIFTSRFTNFDNVLPKIKELVLRSAKLYPNYVVEWTPENL